ncbi:MAG: hypothetical protein ACSHW0_19295 [Thalassotalea sp.]
MKYKIGWLLIAVATLPALYFIGTLLYFSFLHTVELENPLRHEYLQGVVISNLLAMSSWGCVAFGCLLLGEKINYYVRCFVYSVLLTSVISLLVLAVRGV